MLPSDLQYLTDQDIEEIGAALTHVEMMRLQAALQALRGAPASSILLLSCASFALHAQGLNACLRRGRASRGWHGVKEGVGAWEGGARGEPEEPYDRHCIVGPYSFADGHGLRLCKIKTDAFILVFTLVG